MHIKLVAMSRVVSCLCVCACAMSRYYNTQSRASMVGARVRMSMQVSMVGAWLGPMPVLLFVCVPLSFCIWYVYISVSVMWYRLPAKKLYKLF